MFINNLDIWQLEAALFRGPFGVVWFPALESFVYGQCPSVGNHFEYHNIGLGVDIDLS